MGLPGQGDGCPPLIYLTKSPHKVGQPAAASRPGCGPLVGPQRDGARHGRATCRRFALCTGHPMKGGLGPGCSQEARRYPMAAGPSHPNERNSASAGGSRSGPSISAAVCGDGPQWGEAGRAAGAGACAGVGPAPRGGLPHRGFPACSNLLRQMGKCPWIYSLPSAPGVQVPAQIWLPSSSRMLLGPVSWQHGPRRAQNLVLAAGHCLSCHRPCVGMAGWEQGSAGTWHSTGRWRSPERPILGKGC